MLGHHHSAPQPRLHRPGQAGFTLIELMIVLVVIGVLVAAAAPSVLGTLRAQRAHEGARIITLELKKARYQAQSLNRAVGLVVSANNNALYARLSPDNQCGGLLTAPEIIRVDLGLRFPGAKLKVAESTAEGLDTLICIRPSGQVVQASTGLPFAVDNSTLVFSIGQETSLTDLHRIELPYNGVAKMIR
jgi:prepilin-type N-terminal cleavage/methylation domain-containing protein